jgi:hypothetical protein
MNWQDKLRILINAHRQGHPILRYELRFGPPLDSKRANVLLHELAQEFGLDARILNPLGDLSSIADGVNWGGDFKILGLENSRFAFGRENDKLGTLQGFNRDYLHILRESLIQAPASQVTLGLIFGLDDVGDSLCLSDNGSIVRAGVNTPAPKIITRSLNEFLDDICMGPGYARYYQLDEEEEDEWVAVLKEFGFVA